MLLIDQAYSNPNAICTIAHAKSGTSLVGLNESDFGFSVNSQFDSQYDVATQDANTVINAISNFVGAGQYMLKNIRQTISTWTGTSRPTFSVGMTLVNYKSNSDIKGQAAKIVSMASFDWSSWGITAEAPGGYAPRLGSFNFKNQIITGTWSLQIAQYFRAHNLLLVGANPSFSKEIVRTNNQPLMCRLHLTFMPAVLPDRQTIEEWFL